MGGYFNTYNIYTLLHITKLLHIIINININTNFIYKIWGFIGIPYCGRILIIYLK